MNAEDVARKAIDAFNRHDAEGFAALYSEHATAFDPQYDAPLTGRAAIRNDIEAFFRAFPDAHASMSTVLTNGEAVAFEVTMHGTHQGPLISPTGEIPPTNQRIELRGGRFIRIDQSGEIVECNRYYDLAGVMVQLGLV
jgi:steroid delta-isomerase-like uncharacterized protein